MVNNGWDDQMSRMEFLQRHSAWHPFCNQQGICCVLQSGGGVSNWILLHLLHPSSINHDSAIESAFTWTRNLLWLLRTNTSLPKALLSTTRYNPSLHSEQQMSRWCWFHNNITLIQTLCIGSQKDHISSITRFGSIAIDPQYCPLYFVLAILSITPNGQITYFSCKNGFDDDGKKLMRMIMEYVLHEMDQLTYHNITCICCTLGGVPLGVVSGKRFAARRNGSCLILL